MRNAELQSALDQILSERHSCRAFMPDAVPRAVIDKMLTMAQRAPSWCNTQPWEALVLSRSETDTLRSAFLDHVDSTAGDTCSYDIGGPTEYTDERLDRRRECGWALYESVGVVRGDREGSARETRKNFAFFDAPHALIVTTHRELAAYGALDCGLFLATLLYAAQSLGIGAVPQAAIAMHSPFLRESLNIDAERLILFGVSFGYPDKTHPANNFRTTRADSTETVTWVGDWN